MIRRLVARHGEDAIVTAYPLLLDDGATYRWEVGIDGEEVDGVFARRQPHPESPGRILQVVLVHGDVEVELGSWRRDAPEPAAFVRRLGDLT